MNTISMYNNVIEYGETPDAEYYVANGESLKWNGEDETFTIVVKEKSNDEDNYDNFSHVTVDGVLISVDNYTVTKVSARIAFKKALVSAKVVKTGDSSSAFAFAIMFVLTGAALAGVVTYRRKRV